MKESNGISIAFSEEVREVLKKELMDGYVMLAGEIKAIEYIEYNLYPPKSELSKLFKVFFCPSLPYNGFFLCKKTKELEEFLKIPDFDKTLFLIFHSKVEEDGEKSSYLTQQIYRNPNKTIDFAIDSFVKSLNL